MVPLERAASSTCGDSNDCKNVPMRVVNVAGYPVTLLVGAVLADLNAVGKVANQSASASVESEVRIESAYASVLLDGVNSGTSEAVRLRASC